LLSDGCFTDTRASEYQDTVDFMVVVGCDGRLQAVVYVSIGP